MKHRITVGDGGTKLGWITPKPDSERGHEGEMDGTDGKNGSARENVPKAKGDIDDPCAVGVVRFI